MSASLSKLHFGEFEADLRTGELRRNGVRLRLQEQPFQILAALLERPGDVVTREGLRKKLWPEGIHVDFENGLNIAVKKLREALGDEAETPQFIETLPRRGYRFIATVETEAAASPGGRPLSGTPAAVGKKDSKRSGGKMTAIAAAGTIAVALIAFGVRSWLVGAPVRTPIRSIAVLPLQNMSGDPAQDYFADGMTEELITDLAAIRSLHVISRTSSMLYKSPRKPLPQIGGELDADAIIEGAVIRSGGRVRITAQLIEASTDRHLWAASYEENMRDVLSVQDRVAREIADTVRAQLTPQEKQRLATAHPVDPEAYESYLKGRYYAYKLDTDGLDKGEEYFRNTVRIAPGYAPAYTGLAYVWMARAGWTARPADAIPKAREAAEKAVRLDPSLAEAHADLGLVHFWYDWSWPSAEREFRRAIALSPGNVMAHEAYGSSLAWAGRSEQAIEEGRKAVSLDPVSIEAIRTLGESYYFGRRYPEAIACLREAVGMDANYWFAHLSLGRAYLHSGKTREALAELETASRLAPDNPDSLSALANGYAAAGRRAEAQQSLAKLQALARDHYVTPYQFAIVYAALGDGSRAFDLLEQDRRTHSMFVTWLKTDPALDVLRPDARFQKLVAAVPLLRTRQ